MSVPPAQRALYEALKQRLFASAYLLHGEDDYLKSVAVRDLVEAAVDPATRDFNLEFLRGPELDAETLGSHLSTPPMMAERRVIVVRDVTALKKDARSMLDKYLARPANDVVLILIAPAGAKLDKGLSASTTDIEYAPLAGDRIPKWIAYYVEQDLKTKITPEAATLLQEAVGTDLAQLKVELDKLGSFAGGSVIDEAAVSAVVGVRPGETFGALLDAVARRDAVAALGLVPAVLEQPKNNGVTTIMALGVQALAIGWARAGRDRGVSVGRLSSALFDLLREVGSVYTGRSWTEAVRAWAQAVEHWSIADLDAALDALLLADCALKGPRLGSDEQVLSSLVLALCGASRSRRVA
jgi:DNA polymerase III subunit delta